MVYVVERYLPGLDQSTLVPLLGKLGRATQELRTEGTHVRYLGSTIVPGDEACFCQFEGASETAVAEANERAGVPFDSGQTFCSSWPRRSEPIRRRRSSI